MAAIKRILVVTDYSERTRPAETRAAMLGVEARVEMLDLLTVANANDEGIADPMASVEDAMSISTAYGTSPINDGVATGRARRTRPLPTRSLRTGSAATEIETHAVETGADLAVVAAHRGKFFSGTVLGGSSRSLVNMMSRPVLLVNRQPRRPYAYVLVGIDFSPLSFEVASAALAVAPKAHFIFLHALRKDDSRQGDEEATGEYDLAVAHQAMDALMSRLPRSSAFISRLVLRGPVAATILGYADQLSVDLVVLGKHSCHTRETDVGSVMSRITDIAPFDLLVVPGASAQAQPVLPGV